MNRAITTQAPYFALAPAKINLTLDVLGKRPDGYHALSSVMQTIALYDTLAFWPRSDDQISFICNWPDLSSDENLVVRAAHLLRATTGCQQGIHIELYKAIPAQGGLGGGSSDCAKTLSVLNQLWETKLTHDALIELGAQLGSDVPFFIAGGTALVEGRGEIVQPLPPLQPLWFVIIKPDVNVPTGPIFRMVVPADYSDGSATKNLVATIQQNEALPFSEMALFNALEPVVLRNVPEVAATRSSLLAAGCHVIRMSGSGPTLYIPCRSLAEATHIHHTASTMGISAWVTHPVAGD
jgi:4-diphosphocytidyl-2-C-methyl-D-erythritol kinase